MITGYYEPLLNGSRIRSDRHRVPLYARAGRSPDDRPDRALSGFEGPPPARTRRRQACHPVLDARRHRERKRPAGGMKELVYVDDPVEAFFLQIQGSGRVRLAEGGIMRVGYADQNGHPFPLHRPHSHRARRAHG
jgi:membrane-bound lytic murein transglycosylase A